MGASLPSTAMSPRSPRNDKKALKNVLGLSTIVTLKYNQLRRLCPVKGGKERVQGVMSLFKELQ